MHILEYSFKGIKNIKEKQTVTFTNKRYSLSFLSSDQLFDITENNVKGIFGLNGSGKSATLYPLYIFKDIVLNKFIFENSESKNNKFIKTIINKEINEIEMNIEFIVKDVFYYIDVTIGYDDGMLFFKNQKLIKRNNLKNAKKIKVFESLNNRSSYFMLRNSENIADEDLVNIITFFNNIVIITSEMDELNFTKTTSVELPQQVIKEIRQSEFKKGGIFTMSKFLCVNDIEVYRKKIKFFEMLLKKTLKPNLNTIDIEYDEIHETSEKKYEIKDIILDYGYKISIRNESSGIKRLFNIVEEIFDALKSNKVVIVDELDLYLHNDLIEAFINYALYYSKGQFIFTTHDLLTMQPLDGAKKSIYVVNNEQQLVIIPKGGSTTSLSKYQNGKINNTKIPINIYEIDRELI